MRRQLLFWIMAISTVIGYGGSMASPLQADLVGWWPFDGDVTDKSGKGNDGELFDATYVGNVPAVIGSGKALSFKADTDHVLIEADASLDSNVFTLSMFINDPGQQDACDAAGIVCHMERLTSRESDTFETALNLHEPFNGTGEVSYYPGGGWFRGDYVPAVNTWTHVAFVSAGDTMSVYANGVVVIEDQPFSGSPSGFMHIGNRHNDVEGFDGLMDDVALWDETLTAAQVASLASGARRPNTVKGGGKPGDFNQDNVLDATDIDLLSQEVRSGKNTGSYDLNADKIVNNVDRDVWVVSLRKTWYGDSNMDGEFNSTDFVQVFQKGEYEDTTAVNSTWADGDWNGDQEFNSSDFVTAFQGGGFEQGPRAAVSAVPEPCSGLLLLSGILVAANVRRRSAR